MPLTLWKNKTKTNGAGIDYVEDTTRTFANISDNFIPGEAYNVGRRQGGRKIIKEYPT